MFTNRKREEEGGKRITPMVVSLYNIYIVCVFTFKLFFFFVVKQEFLTEASTDLRRQTWDRLYQKREKERKDCMHEKEESETTTTKNDDAFRCSREVL